MCDIRIIDNSLALLKYELEGVNFEKDYNEKGKLYRLLWMFFPYSF